MIAAIESAGRVGEGIAIFQCRTTAAAPWLEMKLGKEKQMTAPIRTPADDGLYMPAEWAPHERCWMQWPTRGDVWGERFPETYRAYARVARAIAEFEPVSMVVNPEDEAQARLACGRGIDIVVLEIDDSWARDSGPIFLTDGAGHVGGVHWKFNSWGGKFAPWTNDERIGGEILKTLGMRKYRGPQILEGGSICVDGQGTLMTTQECLLNHNRNPHLTQQEIEQNLALYFGISKIIWLDRGLEDDETDGHVDMIACFAKPGTVLLAMPDDHNDPNYERMSENARRLARSRDAQGRSIEVIEVPLPRNNLRRSGGERLCQSYINFYFANGGIVVPVFDDPNDERAVKILSEVFPDRKISPVPGFEISLGGGCIHCITQQQPAGVPLTA